MPHTKAVRDELEKILASSVFTSSPRMRRFLAFVVEEKLSGRASQIKEYVIAVEVFGKRSDYDPGTDSTVRTEATKLRARLERYYIAEGASDPLVISLPKGGYVPVFRDVEVPQRAANSDDAAPLAPTSVPQADESRNVRSWHLWLRTPILVPVSAVLISIVAIAATWLHWWVQRERKLVQLEAKGSVLVDSWSQDEILRGIDYYRKVVSLDPKSASAYAAIAGSYLLLSDIYMDPRAAMPKAALAAKRAIELDRRLADPHITLGMVKLQFDWDWTGAEKELKTAIALSPGETTSHQLYGWYLMAERRFEEARGEMEYAISLDPSSDFSFWELGLCYYFSRRYEDSAEQDRRAIALEPKSYWPHMLLGWTLEQQGKFDEAISELTIASRLTDSPQVIAALAHAHAMAGRRDAADHLLQDLMELSKRRYVSPYDVATVYAGSADTEQTLTFLDKACAGRSGWLPLWLKVDPKFDAIRGQERFSALLRRVDSARF